MSEDYTDFEERQDEPMGTLRFLHIEIDAIAKLFKKMMKKVDQREGEKCKKSLGDPISYR